MIYNGYIKLDCESFFASYLRSVLRKSLNSEIMDSFKTKP